MMAHVPAAIREAGIVRVVLDHLLLGDAEALCVVEVAVCKLENLAYVLAAQGRLAKVRSDRWSHLTENHNVVFRHMQRMRVMGAGGSQSGTLLKKLIISITEKSLIE